MSPEYVIIVTVAFFAASLLYSSVGHGGASAYLLVMTLLSFAPETFRPTALTLNVVVSGIATIGFARAGAFRWSLFLPAILGSIPFAFIGAAITISPGIFHGLLALALLFAGVRLLIPAPSNDHPIRHPSPAVIAPCGMVIGLLSGLAGIGGGIFLTPLLIFMRWAPARTAAAVSAPFVLVNSLTGLMGLGSSGFTPHPLLAVLIPSVMAGGLLGARWGSQARHSKPLKLALGIVLLLAGFKLLA